jgi:hypothetical protein
MKWLKNIPNIQYKDKWREDEDKEFIMLINELGIN